MRDEFHLLVIMEVIEMKISNDFDKLYKVVSEDDLSDVVGGKRKLPGWVKWVNGIGGLIGSAAEPGSINWNLYK